MTNHLAVPTMPVHHFTGLTAIGFRRNGDPIWPVKGGSSDHDGAEGGDSGGADGGQDEGDDGGQDDDKPLGAAGEKALQAEKEKRRKAAADLRPWSALARDLGVRTPEEIRALIAGKNGDGGDGQVDVDKVRREADAEATRRANTRILRAEVKALAAGKFADPADAPMYLNLDEFDVDDDGEVDGDAIKAALDDVLKKKPHLAAQGGRRFQGSGDGGHRGGSKADPGPGVNRIRAAYAQPK